MWAQLMDTTQQHIFYLFQASSEIVYVFALVVSVFLLIGGTDDLLVDLYYWLLYLFSPRKLNRYRLEPREKLHSVKEKPLAIFVPTWHEYDVIEKMLTHTCQILQYKKYDIFVGVYPNDPRTFDKVQRITERYPQVHMVVSNHPGPSTKADNLNEIHQGMLRWENQTGIRYDIIVMHDAEDVIHPLSLKVHNYFIPRYDMVQLPVFPLEVPHSRLVHWTYADEFAEHHTKDLAARQIYSSFMPSAGIGTGYSRWLIEFVGTSFARNMFRKASLTEDYDIALRLALGGSRLLFLYKPFGINVATRAYFPETFSAAVRQKTRWLIGICLQSWKSFGWVGVPIFRFTLYRDRKAIFTNVINVLAYIVLFYIILYEAARWALTDYGTLHSIIKSGTALYTIVLIDTGLMIWRSIHRFLTVNRIYGWVAALLSIVRFPIGNFINFTATVRAIVQYLLSGEKEVNIPWHKTAHTFPTIGCIRRVLQV